MKIVFTEVQDWEEARLKKEFPDAVLTPDKLTAATATQYADADVVSCFIYSTIDKAAIDALANLKYISTRSTGFDHIDAAYCKTKNIVVSNVPEYGSNTVAEHTFALLLSLTRAVYQSVNQMRMLNFEHGQLRGVDLEGKTIGIVGLGKIGQHVLRIAHGFGMKALGYNRSQDQSMIDKYGLTYCDLDTLLASSDVVTLHLPLNEHTKHIINKDSIEKFKKGSYLVNTARGGLIESEAIVIGLEKGILAGVGLDVIDDEKDMTEEIAILTSQFQQQINLKNLVYNHILMNHPKVLVTPHNAFNSQEALARILETTIGNIRSFLSGAAVNTV